MEMTTKFPEEMQQAEEKHWQDLNSKWPRMKCRELRRPGEVGIKTAHCNAFAIFLVTKIWNTLVGRCPVTCTEAKQSRRSFHDDLRRFCCRCHTVVPKLKHPWDNSFALGWWFFCLSSSRQNVFEFLELFLCICFMNNMLETLNVHGYKMDIGWNLTHPAVLQSFCNLF